MESDNGNINNSTCNFKPKKFEDHGECEKDDSSDNDDTTDSETESESDSSVTSESVIRASWGSQFSHTKHYYCPDEDITCSDEFDLCQQLIINHAKNQANKDAPLKSGARDADSCTKKHVNVNGTSNHFDDDSDANSTLPNGHSKEDLDELKELPPQVTPLVDKCNNGVIENKSPTKRELRHYPRPHTSLVDETTAPSDGASKSFTKGVPLDPSATWDFSLQRFDENYKSKCIWLEGPFYQKFIGECLHEMHNVACGCEEKKKTSVCRLCHTVFCSNKCFKKAIKSQRGVELDAFEERVSSGNADKKLDTQTTVKNTPPSENRRIVEKQSCKKYRDHPAEKPLVSEQNKTNPCQTIRISIDKENNGGFRQQCTHSNQNGYSSSGTNHQSGSRSSSNSMSIPTQVLMNNAFSDSSNNDYQFTNDPKNSHGNIHKVPQDRHGSGGMSSPSSSNFYKDGSRERENPIPQDIGTRNQGHAPCVSETSNNDKEESKVFFSSSRRRNTNAARQNSKSPPKRQNSNIQSAQGYNPRRGISEGKKILHELDNQNPVSPNTLSQQQFNRTATDSHSFKQTEDGGDNFKRRNHNLNACSSNKESENFNKPYNDNRGSVGGWQRQAPGQSGFANDFQGRTGQRDNFSPPPSNQMTRGKHLNQRDMSSRNNSFPFEQQQDGRWQSSNNERGSTRMTNSTSGEESYYSARSSQYTELSSSSSYYTPSGSNSGYAKCSTPNTNPSNNLSSSSNSGNDLKLNLLSRGAPVGVPFPVKYVRGKGFSDFSVMTLKSHALFGSLHHLVQKCTKRKMEICEFNNYCLAEYAASDEENSPKEWYRGIITKLVVDRVGIYFIDLGLETVTYSRDVYHLPREFVGDSPYAIRIRCINMKADSNDPEVLDEFDSLVRKSTMKIRITHQDTVELFRFACYMDVMYMDKWFDVGVLLKKLQVGDKASQEDIRAEEHQKFITPLPLVELPREPLWQKFSEKFKAKIVFVDNPNKFYVTTEEQLEHDIAERLNNIPVQEVRAVRSMEEVSGLLFMTLDDDDKWKRVKVQEVGTDPDTVVVQKIDEGEIVTVPLQKLNLLPPSLKLIPNCVYKCSLPVRQSRKQRDRVALFEKTTEFLKDDLAKIPLLVQVISIDDSNTHIVDLFLPKSTTAAGCTASFVKQGWVELSQNLNIL